MVATELESYASALAQPNIIEVIKQKNGWCDMIYMLHHN